MIVSKGDDFITTSLTRICIDTTIKAEANELSSEFSIDLSSAVSMFLRQCILRGGLFFKVELPRFDTEALTAMKEARRISRDPNASSYLSTEDLKEALLSD